MDKYRSAAHSALDADDLLELGDDLDEVLAVGVERLRAREEHGEVCTAMPATWCATHGSAATFLSCAITFESTSSRGAHSLMGTLRPLIVENGMIRS